MALSYIRIGKSYIIYKYLQLISAHNEIARYKGRGRGCATETPSVLVFRKFLCKL